MATFGVNIAFWLFFGCILGAAMALQCYKCGMYNDGVGSITPCINDTNMPLLVCPDKDHKYCIKYQSEGSTVRDCVAACTEREDWGAKTFCCDEDGCNSAAISKISVVFTTTVAMLCIFLR